MNETTQSIHELTEKLGLHDKARELASAADWYKDVGSPTLSEYCRYAHKAICDLIEAVFAECTTLDEICELIDKLQYESWNDSKYYLSQGFMHFAELAMVKYRTLCNIAAHIQLNK